MALRAVTLDAAGTLFEVAEPVGATYARFGARHGIALAASDVEQRFQAAFATAPPLAFPADSPAAVADRERAWWCALVRRAFGPAAVGPRFDACFEELFVHFGGPEAWRVFPDVPDALAELRARGFRIGVTSNFDDRLITLIAGLGLAALLDAVVPSTHAGAAKPDPAIFQATLARLGVPPAEALHVGDTVDADVAGARAAGLHAVLLDRRGRRPAVPSGTPVITTLADLSAVADTIGHTA